jgi:uncharacterized membrane protein
MNAINQHGNAQSHAMTSQWVDSLWFRTLLIIAFALGLFFRLSGLGNKIYSHDEAYTSLRVAGYTGGEVFTNLADGKDKTREDIQKYLRPDKNKNIVDTLSIIAWYEPHENPLFFLLAHYWMRLVGYTPGAMRGLAALFGLLSIPGMYWLSRELFKSSSTALLSTALFVISPFHILFAQDARPYSLLSLCILISSASFLRAIRKVNALSWGIYSLTLILGVYSQLLFVLVVIAHGVYFLGAHFKHYKLFGSFLLSSASAVLAYTPWLYFVVTRWKMVSSKMDWVNFRIPWYRYIQRWMLIFSSPLIDLDFKSGNLIPYILRALLLSLVACAFLFLLLHASKQEWLLILSIYVITTGAIIVPDLLQGGIRSIGGRYFVPTNITTILVMGYFLANRLSLSSFKAHKKWRLLISIVIVSALSSNINSMQAETWWNKELGRVRTEFVHEINKDRSLLIISGYHPTNLGDILLLSFEADSDMRFRLYEEPVDIKIAGNYDYIYWFPSSVEEVWEISEKESLQVREVLNGTLWQIQQ